MQLDETFEMSKEKYSSHILLLFNQLYIWKMKHTSTQKK